MSWLLVFQEKKKWFIITISKSNILQDFTLCCHMWGKNHANSQNEISRSMDFELPFVSFFAANGHGCWHQSKPVSFCLAKLALLATLKFVIADFFRKQKLTHCFFSFTHLLITIWCNFVKFEFEITEKSNENSCDTKQNLLFFKNSELFLFLSLHQKKSLLLFNKQKLGWENVFDIFVTSSL